MTKSQLEEAIGLSYMTVETELGSRVYGLLQCFRQEHPGQNILEPYRTSAPFVVSEWYGKQNIVVGSVCHLLDGIRHLLDDLAESARISVTKLRSPECEGKGDLFLRYTRDVTNNVILISAQTRNLSHVFPRLADKLTIPIFTYEGNQDGNIRVFELLNLFVHNRYFFFDGEYITDLFSAEFSKKSPISGKFMGYKFKLNDYLGEIHAAIHSITMKDLTTMLRSRIKSLGADLPHNDMVFLVQNMESFSGLLGALIPTEKYDFMVHMLFDNTVPTKTFTSPTGVVTRQVVFHEPHIKMTEKMSDKKIRVSVRCDLGGDVVAVNSPNSKLHTVEVGYEDFFNSVNKACGTESLLALCSLKDSRAVIR